MHTNSFYSFNVALLYEFVLETQILICMYIYISIYLFIFIYMNKYMLHVFHNTINPIINCKIIKL